MWQCAYLPYQKSNIAKHHLDQFQFGIRPTHPWSGQTGQLLLVSFSHQSTVYYRTVPCHPFTWTLVTENQIIIIIWSWWPIVCPLTELNDQPSKERMKYLYQLKKKGDLCIVYAEGFFRGRKTGAWLCSPLITHSPTDGPHSTLIVPCIVLISNQMHIHWLLLNFWRTSSTN